MHKSNLLLLENNQASIPAVYSPICIFTSDLFSEVVLDSRGICSPPSPIYIFRLIYVLTEHKQNFYSLKDPAVHQGSLTLS